MYEAEADPKRNLRLMTFRERVRPVDLAQGRAQVAVALEAMKPGFRLLADLSGLDSMEYACAPEIQATMDLLREKGVAVVVRVVPDPHKDIGFTVMSYFHYDRETSVLMFASRAEALEKLSA